MQLEGEDPIVMPYCRSPAPSRLSSGGYRPVNLPLAQHCFPTILVFHILLSMIAYLLQGTPRIRWPRIRLVCSLLGTRYASRGRLPIRSLAVFARPVSSGGGSLHYCSATITIIIIMKQYKKKKNFFHYYYYWQQCE